MPAPLRLRPLEIGDLLDETFRLYRRHFFLFAGISVILSIPTAALYGAYFALLGGLVQQAGATGQPADATTVVSVVVGFALLGLLALVLVPFTYGAVCYAACEAAMGRRVTAGAMVRGVLHRYFQLLGYWVLIGLMFSVGICLFPLWIWIGVCWVVVMPVMFVEGAGLGAAMSRSWRLVEGHWWRTFLILFLMGVVVEVVRLALGAFFVIGQQLLLLFFNSYLLVAISGAIETIVVALANPIFQIVLVLIYFDLRVRREAIDLFQLAQRVAGPQPAS